MKGAEEEVVNVRWQRNLHSKIKSSTNHTIHMKTLKNILNVYFDIFYGEISLTERRSYRVFIMISINTIVQAHTVFNYQHIYMSTDRDSIANDIQQRI